MKPMPFQCSLRALFHHLTVIQISCFFLSVVFNMMQSNCISLIATKGFGDAVTSPALAGSFPHFSYNEVLDL